MTVCFIFALLYSRSADIKQYIGPPSLHGRYEILRSCISELVRVGIVSQHTSIPDWKTFECMRCDNACCACSRFQFTSSHRSIENDTTQPSRTLLEIARYTSHPCIAYSDCPRVTNGLCTNTQVV